MNLWLELSWFLLGLTIGLILLSWYHFQLQLKLKRLIRDLRPDALPKALSLTAMLTRAVSAQLQAQQDLEQQLEAWKQVFYVAPIGFLQVDEENQLLWCNAKACQLLSLQQAPYSRPRLLLELVRSYELDELIEQTRAAHQPCERDWVFNPVSADQSTLSQQQPRPLRGYGFPLVDGCVGVFLENRQEAVLLAQQRDRWTSDVAHELKTPLTSIRLVAETLQARLEPGLRHWIDRLLKETIRLSGLVQDLLDLSQLEASPIPHLAFKTVDLIKLIQSTWSSLEPLARRKQLQLDYIGPDSVLIQADEMRLHRVLLNLLDNSIKYSPAQRSIRVQVSLAAVPQAEPQVCIEVIDWGPGFPESALPYVFDRFYRVDPSRTRVRAPDLSKLDAIPEVNSCSRDGASISAADGKAFIPTSSGSGLGLAIVRQIVEAHQGSVKAGNHPETQGAWLQVFLPLQANKKI